MFILDLKNTIRVLEDYFSRKEIVHQPPTKLVGVWIVSINWISLHSNVLHVTLLK